MYAPVTARILIIAFSRYVVLGSIHSGKHNIGVMTMDIQNTTLSDIGPFPLWIIIYSVIITNTINIINKLHPKNAFNLSVGNFN
jgi:uncharacterized membrane protein